MLDTLYKGSVKDVLGPVADGSGGTPAVVFNYSDAFSVFDWGRMPDALAAKGKSLAVLAADWFERLEKAESWREFSRSPEALALRKANRFGSAFNELGENLQAQGLRTHYRGVLEGESITPRKLSDLTAPVSRVLVTQVNVAKPTMSTVLGRGLPDYTPTRSAPAPRLVPLEVVFRFSCPPGSSLFERVARDPGYLTSIGFPDARVAEGQKWDFPVLEPFTKLESTDRPLTLGEALSISGLTALQLQDLLLKTAWVAGFLRHQCAKSGLELADGKLEWGVDGAGQVFLVDAIGPDELRILKDGVQLSKEFLRNFYRDTPWYEAIGKAKTQAKTQGSADWKRLVPVGPPALPPHHRELATQLYLALANQLTGRNWFPEAWPLEKVIAELKKV
jgi:phosphoribosylaminoimidazole-succinocarboxamide synthase